MKRSLAAALAALSAALTVAVAPPAAALPASCEVVPWGFLGSQQRGICDGPVQRDGSWMRHRIVAVPAHSMPVFTSCSGGTYTTFCTTSGGGFMPYTELDNEWYRVTPDTVPPNEPGYLG